jgi:class 3 adenylate cyclase
LEDLCSDIVRWQHSGGDLQKMLAVRVEGEIPLGGPFADLRVDPPSDPGYFVEVKYGLSADEVVAKLRRKYSNLTEQVAAGARRLILVAQAEGLDLSAARSALPPFLELEVWDEARVLELANACFGIEIRSLAPNDLMLVRNELERGRELAAFGSRPAHNYSEVSLRHQLLWHFGVWRLRGLRLAAPDEDPWSILPPGVYQDVVAVYADLSGFSRAMRETPDDGVVRRALTNFYAKARYQVINAGGMLDQFVGDAVIALFGLPDQPSGYVDSAIRSAHRLTEIGASVSYDWQRRIDTVQPALGVHVGMAIGRVQVVPLRNLDHARIGVLGDPVNLAARLVALAEPGQVVASNALARRLEYLAHPMQRLEEYEAHNMGRMQPWLVLRQS